MLRQRIDLQHIYTRTKFCHSRSHLRAHCVRSNPRNALSLRVCCCFDMHLTSCLCASLFSSIVAQTTHDLVGTWASKSKAVVTGPGFFNPLTDSLLEPNHTGVSYSFTSDGYYESALYTITGDPTTPSCPTGVLQWAHGSYTLNTDGGILMVPIAVDGRQIVSEPCLSSTSTYSRFSANDSIQSYSIVLDTYRAEWKLTLNKEYGSPVQPLYLIYDPPQMLPTTTLLPTSTPTSSSKRKRSLGHEAVAMPMTESQLLNGMWYTAVGMIIVGAFGFICI